MMAIMSHGMRHKTLLEGAVKRYGVDEPGPGSLCQLIGVRSMELVLCLTKAFIELCDVQLEDADAESSFTELNAIYFLQCIKSN